MAVQFILGRSGTGKTRCCIESVCEDLRAGVSEPIVLLLPEQATYQAERAILTSEGIGGYSNLEVLSFNRLQFRLAQLSGRNAGGAELSRLGCRMVVRKVLGQLGDRLGNFGNVAGKDGFAAELASTIQRLFESEIDAGQLRCAAEKLMGEQAGELAGRKFADIALVLEKYSEFFTDSSGRIINPDCRLTEAVKDVWRADFLKGARVYVDGFASFTVQEMSLLMEVLKVSSTARIAICLDAADVDLAKPDADSLDPMSIFSRCERTYAELFEALRRCRIEIAEPMVLDEVRRFDSGALKHIEKNLFSEGKVRKISAGGSVEVAAAANMRGEVDAVASRIVELVKERGYRFRDMAVIASDLAGYEHYIEASFADNGIACFIDRPKAMSSHPAAELIVSALRAVLGEMKTSDVLAYLKTGLAGLAACDVDVLENYCVLCGVDGADWSAKKNWEFAGSESGFDQARIDTDRRKAVEPLLNLKNKLCAAEEITAERFGSAIFGLLEEPGIGEKIRELAADDSSAEQRQFYNKLVDIFEEMVRVFGETPARVDEFAAMISGALSEICLKLIPPKLDQVLVGSIERSRHPDLKAVFLVGVTQKDFPSAIGSEVLLTDDDRQIGEEFGLGLGDSLIEKLSARQYLAYIAFTRASELLYISYPRADGSGKKELCSPFLNNLTGLFGDLRETSSGKSAGTVCDMLCGWLGAESGRKKEDALAVADELIKEGSREAVEAGELLRYSLEYKNLSLLDVERLKDCGADLIKDNKLECSTSRLRSFAECPYKHFAEYVLKLKRRKSVEFTAMDMGSLYHKVLDSVAKELIKLSKGFGDVDDGELEKLCADKMRELLEKDRSAANFARRSGYNSYVIVSAGEVITDAVKAYARLSRAGDFKLAASEVRFGFEGSRAQCRFALADGTEVVLRGVIDRVDTAEIDGRVVGIVFDYKLSDKSVSYSMLGNRIDMQLPIYMLAAKSISVGGRQIDEIAGAFYLPIQIATADGDLDKIEEGERKLEYKAKGIFDAGVYESMDRVVKGWSEFYNFAFTKDGPLGYFGISGAVTGEQLGKVVGFTEESVKVLATEIVAGKIEITPYRINKNSPCGNCDYRPVCRFDWQINDYNRLSGMDKKEFLAGLEGER